MKANVLSRQAAARIGGGSARLDAELLLGHVLRLDRGALLLRDPVVGPEEAARFEGLVQRRVGREPVAYILGEKEFWSLTLRVTPDVLVPRPDSEVLVAGALSAMAGRDVQRVLDLGTGSGALLLALLHEWPGAFGVGVDRSAAAVAVARGNAAALGLGGRAAFVVGDWADALGDGGLDVLVCNPPYVEDGAALMADVGAFEPAAALFGGADGLDAYRRLVPAVGRLLAPGGVALFEFGVGQEGALLALAREAGWPGVRMLPDLSGRPRAMLLEGWPQAVGTGLGKGVGSG